MKRIFITGASGCIGHYMTEALIQDTNHELYLLVRNPDRLQFDCNTRPGIHILQGDMSSIEEYSDLLLKDIDVAILAATAWGGQGETYDINVVKTLSLINLLNPKICERVIYFSTASILDRNNQLLLPASQFGHDYIRTKYQCFAQLGKTAIADKIIAVFPTLVFGGEADKPYSHLSAGIADVTKWIDLIRWFSVDGSFHFIHARDIARIMGYLVEHPDFSPSSPESPQEIDCLVLGNPAITVDQAIADIGRYFNKRVYFRFPLYTWLTNIFISIFQIQMDSWSRFSLDYRHFSYTNPVTPASFGLQNYCSTVEELMKVSRVRSSPN
ncbi:NAD(P)-dependent oxidoreductase [Waterburya agarophytonicola K14]|uniref:NAD(P)-dependent oxidoreductase n=1 Tax=Waterburya agarophytonicola KI4 TaxID=2874699 RepID=A0A964BQ97_9CYAN|nr:NAD(P)-dependent oxidoreductase [Waterburya agarophytonicola]MCC0176498.1 NAD(P)-dependent oxidoreductase [Waterburya agarophytonicola KI4]